MHVMNINGSFKSIFIVKAQLFNLARCVVISSFVSYTFIPLRMLCFPCGSIQFPYGGTTNMFELGSNTTTPKQSTQQKRWEYSSSPQ